VSDPRDWFRPTIDNGEEAYLVTREGVIMLVVWMDGEVPTRARVEIANIVAAWYRGEIFPRSAAPTITMLLDHDSREPQPPESPPPIEIAGGVSGLQKHLVELAKENRGLSHAVLKKLFEQHQVVVAVWESPDKVPGPGFLTMKGVEYLLAQAKRNPKKIRATMTALWCNSREHAELLQQTLRSQQ
jgi:hypothetical protein